MTLDKDIGEDAPRRSCTIQGITPGIVDQVPEFRKNCQCFRQSLGQATIRHTLIGHWSADINPVIIVACRTVIPICDKTSPVRIFNALPVSLIMSGSHRTLNTSPTIGSRTLNGSRTSSFTPFMNLNVTYKSVISRQSREYTQEQ